jgi:hypothetical protein
MLDLVGRVPDPGDSVEVDGFRLTALDVRGRRIGRVRIEPMHIADGDGDGDGGGGGSGGGGGGIGGEGDRDGGRVSRNGR